jgi:glutathione synthase/RimK-type ligase-like ATP-grasp enzyme
LREAERLERELGWPMVLKIPDGSFSRGVHKVADREELNRTLRMLFDDTELVLAQEFMPTAFDWRIGVLDGEPLFACQYLMARNHWQIVRHGEGGKALEGAMRAVQLAAAPAQVVQTAVKAARLIGRGLYGVDIKQNDRGVFVIEVNDNPNLVHGEEDDAEGDIVWRKITVGFLMRLA